MTADRLTFERWRDLHRDMAGWARREAFRFQPEHDQDAAWNALHKRCRLQHESDWAAEKRLLYKPWPPVKRRRPHQGTPQSTSTRTERVQFVDGDPLKRIPAVQYLPAIASVDVSSSGRCRCPMRDHEDVHPSCKTYGTRWVCFSCGAKGGVIEVASEVYGVEPRGRDFWRLRDLILEALGEPVEGGLHG
jgi:hypothetical protein